MVTVSILKRMKTKWSFFIVGVFVGLGIAVALRISVAKPGRAHYGPNYPVLEISQGGTGKWVYPKK
jgi:hypothetical protein